MDTNLISNLRKDGKRHPELDIRYLILVRNWILMLPKVITIEAYL